MLISLFILCLFAAICSLYIAKDENSNKKYKIKIIAISEIVIGLLITGISYYNDFESDRQHNRIERFDSLNNRLAEKIKSLSLLNNSIATSSRTIELDNKNLAIKNSELSDTIKFIVNSIKNLTNKNNKLSARIRAEVKQSYSENSMHGTLVFKFRKPVKSINDITFLMARGKLIPSHDKILSSQVSLKINNSVFPFLIGVLNNKVYLYAEIVDQNNRHLMSIEKNNWIVNPHVVSRLNYDDNGLEVIDDMSNVLFSIDILPDNKIKFQGFIYTTNVILVVGDKEMTLIDDIKNFKESNKYFRKLFLYTGASWLHKRAY